jgi:hypothetical protein
VVAVLKPLLRDPYGGTGGLKLDIVFYIADTKPDDRDNNAPRYCAVEGD